MSIDYNEQAFCPTHVFLAMIGSLGIVPPDGSHDQIREWLERDFLLWTEDLGLEHHREPRIFHAFLAEKVILFVYHHPQQQEIGTRG